MTIEKRKHRGRPTEATTPGEKTTLSLRVAADLKERLNDAAKASDRPLSKEAEMRLEQSFRDQRLMIDALVLVYGKPLAGLILTLADQLKMTGRAVAFKYTHTLEGADAWLDNPNAYDQAVRDVAEIMERLRPAGEILPPKSVTIPGAPDIQGMLNAAMATGYASGHLATITGEIEAGGATGESATVKRELLGYLVDRARIDRPTPARGE